MKQRFLLITGIMFFSCIHRCYAQDIFAGYENLFTTPLQYTACKSIDPIHIDGKLTELSWNKAAWSDYFTDIEGDKKPAPTFQTRFKMAWDSQYLYIAAELQEPHVWATIKEHDSIVFRDNDFEIFIDPDGDTHNYFEIEINAVNTIFDLLLVKPYRNGGPAIYNWDAQKMRSAISVTGTLNRTNDTDKKWSVEMAIPFHSLDLGGSFSKLRNPWRINFSRVEWDTEISKGLYVKKTDSITHRAKAEHNWVWSPQGVINMHLPERWGYLFFSNEKAGTVIANTSLTAAEQVKKYLWLLYYKQRDYQHQQRQFATTLGQLSFPSSIEPTGLNCIFGLEATTSQFKATARCGDEKWQIDQDGKINKL